MHALWSLSDDVVSRGPRCARSIESVCTVNQRCCSSLRLLRTDQDQCPDRYAQIQKHILFSSGAWKFYYLLDGKKIRALRGVVEVVVVCEARKWNWSRELHAHFHASFFLSRRDHRVFRNMILSFALGKLIANPRSVVSLSGREINFVLHRVFEIV